MTEHHAQAEEELCDLFSSQTGRYTVLARHSCRCCVALKVAHVLCKAHLKLSLVSKIELIGLLELLRDGLLKVAALCICTFTAKV